MSNLEAPPSNNFGLSESSEALFHSKAKGGSLEKNSDWSSGGNSGSVNSSPESRQPLLSSSKSWSQSFPSDTAGWLEGSISPSITMFLKIT